jgi:nitrate reductase gamma subunit
VLAWNGRPFRLYILEVTAAALALSALIGLIVLAVRRYENKRIRSVTSEMDIVMYIVLATVVITGLSTAIFSRWGSSWFAVVMTPYLRSVLFFRPDISVVNTLPLIVKIHVVSTFVFFMILPYTRLIHMLAYPFTYLWREYQLVIWNKRKPPEGAESRATTIPVK